MARETTKWPSTRWPIPKIMSSDGCNGNRIPLEMGPWYDFREFGCHLGNVGLARSPILNLVWKWICVWLAGKRKLQVTRRFRVVALQSIGAVAVARDNSMSRTAFETSRPIRSILRT